MTKATMNMGHFTIEGHAGYSTHGHDVVCAGISTLAYTFVNSIDPINVKIENGYLDCTFTPSVVNCIKYEMLIDGLRMIQEQYPIHLEVLQNDTTI